MSSFSLSINPRQLRSDKLEIIPLIFFKRLSLTCRISMAQKVRRRIGIVGYGQIGQFLVQQITTQRDDLGLELAFVWNRTKSTKLTSEIDNSLILDNLNDFYKFKPDIIVEVAHPSITKEYGPKFVQQSDYLIGSPSAIGDPEVESALKNASQQFGVFIPSGALWGTQDIRKMSDRGALKELKIKMHFHPSNLKLEGEAKLLNENVKEEATVIYEGPVRGVCKIAPNNVNTMAAAAIAGQALGFDGTLACLISDPNLKDYHKIEVEITGPKGANNCALKVYSTRWSPAVHGQVTSSATLQSFWSSLISL